MKGRLKEYIEKDEVYQAYKNGRLTNISDFDKFCIQHCKDIEELLEKNESLKKQLDYLRTGEYYNQLRFENEMLQDVIDNGEVSKEDKKFIDCTHRNTELLNQQQEFIKYLEDEINKTDYEINILGNYPYLAWSNACKKSLQKYKEIIGVKDGK